MSLHLKCHAITKSGKMCGARARSFYGGRPACDRLAHMPDDWPFLPMTTESVQPYKLSEVKAVIEFLSGDSFEEVARKRGWSLRRVQETVRRMM